MKKIALMILLLLLASGLVGCPWWCHEGHHGGGHGGGHYEGEVGSYY